MPRPCLVVIALAAVAGSALAGPRTVAGVALPSRRADAPTLTTLAARLGRAAAPRRGASLAAIRPGADDLAVRLARAASLLADGQVDEAAATYDLALDAADQAPGSGDAAALITAHVARAEIALARGEQARADTLLGRLLRWDADFTPTADENTPAIKAALDRLRASAAAPLAAADLGASCRQVDTLIAVRAAPAGAIEVARFDGCTEVASVVSQGVPGDALVLDRLGLAAAATPKARDRPGFYRRPWFWITVSAVAVGAAGVWALGASQGGGGYDVAVRF